MTVRHVLVLALLILPVPVLGQGWRAWNGTIVTPVGKGVFEVIPRGRSGPREFWCGAGDYALSVLQVPVTQRIFIWRAIGPSAVYQGSKSVQFALSPPPGKENVQPGYSLSVRAEGDNIQAAMARRYCLNDNLFWPDLGW